jgi:hypothetical protein
MIRDVLPGFRIQGVKKAQKHRIPDPRSGSATLIFEEGLSHLKASPPAELRGLVAFGVFFLMLVSLKSAQSAISAFSMFSRS